jgi:hypothetical protein
MTRQRLIVLTAALFVVGVGIDLVIGYSPFPGYGASLGLVGSFVLILGAKALGSAFVVRAEDLYPDEIPPDVAPDLPVAPGADIDAWPQHPVKADHLDSIEAAPAGRSRDTDAVPHSGRRTASDADPTTESDTRTDPTPRSDPRTASDTGTDPAARPGTGPDRDRGAGRD